MSQPCCYYWWWCILLPWAKAADGISIVSSDLPGPVWVTEELVKIRGVYLVRVTKIWCHTTGKKYVIYNLTVIATETLRNESITIWLKDTPLGVKKGFIFQITIFVCIPHSTCKGRFVAIFLGKMLCVTLYWIDQIFLTRFNYFAWFLYWLW